jgi:hypothetical protein
VERAQRVPRPGPRQARWFVVTSTLAAAAAALLLVRTDAQPVDSQEPMALGGVRTKGALVEAEVRIGSTGASGQRGVGPDSTTSLQQGDRVRIGYRTADPRYLVALAVDEAGVVTALYPQQGQALAVSPSKAMTFLPDSLEFTGKGREKVILYLLTAPTTVDELTARIKANADPIAVSDLVNDVFTWRFDKQ